jgi:integrase
LPSREGGHWTEAHLRKTFRGWCHEARIPAKAKMHGLRKVFACWLLDNGCTEGQIAAALGDTIESIRPYIAAYNKRLAGAAGIRKAAQRKAA